MAKFRDFDAYFEEKQQQQPVLLRYQGEMHHLPAAIPMAAVLMLRRMATENGTVNDEGVIKLFQTVFGANRYSKWVQNGMTLNEMIELLGWALEQYGLANAMGNTPAREAEPEPNPLA